MSRVFWLRATPINCAVLPALFNAKPIEPPIKPNPIIVIFLIERFIANLLNPQVKTKPDC